VSNPLVIGTVMLSYLFCLASHIWMAGLRITWLFNLKIFLELELLLEYKSKISGRRVLNHFCEAASGQDMVILLCRKHFVNLDQLV
jgi:hypothetical protein